MSAAIALRELGDERAVGPLARALGDSDREVRKTAVEALVRIGEPAVEAFI